ncbi:MAG: glycosyltransferase family 2 protein [Cytophagales bacterium]|nr:glycosyltransferase family 2 protein [Cytophagales bacterium]
MISIVCPTLNEDQYIAPLLDFFLLIEPREKEIWIADGGSTDQTRNIVNRYATLNKNIFLVDNPKKFVPFALNLLIPKCKGEIIVRWDAHTTYAPDYLLQIVSTFNKTKASIVGGPMRAIGNSPFQIAVAHATSTAFGVGNSSFHFENFEGATDSVYLGAWKREIFESIGLFDELMLRNQDDEFHYRARQAGLLIYQNPDIKSYYYPRQSVGSLARQYFGYGNFKPLVLRKNNKEWKLRHFVPAFFLVYLVMLSVLGWIFPVVLVPLFLYAILNVYFSFFCRETPRIKFFCLLIFPVLHISYGFGFCLGLFKRKK